MKVNSDAGTIAQRLRINIKNHFCHQLDVKWQYKICGDSEIAVDKENCIYQDQAKRISERYTKDNILPKKTELRYV